uniref:DNA-directed DNA polymerase n=1 Tax=viral metagenome TaxID=1070528 RepID=A0A6C0FB09_9ZZZZ|tara:strand:+ start:9506 stop:13303 length:3798 start_codon:yes stop_codon:yes gene_type:complete
MDDEITFQIIDIDSDDIPIDFDGNPFDKEFTITFYGKTEEGKDVSCNVIGFKPYFFMRVPKSWNKTFTTTFIRDVIIRPKIDKLEQKEGIKREKDRQINKEKFIHSKNLPCNITIKESKNFYGLNYDFEHNRIYKYKYAKMEFDTYSSMRKICNTIIAYHKERYSPIINKEIKCDKKILEWFKQDHNCDCVANLYESKIHPTLRFIHEKNIESCGWVRVKIPNREFNIIDEAEQIFNVDIEISKLKMSNITPLTSDSTAPFITASFDIECDSSHGDFPNPIKDFKKVVIDIHEAYFRNCINLNPTTSKKLFIKRCIEEAFNGGSNDIQSIYTSNGCYSENGLKNVMSKITDEVILSIDESKTSSKTRDTIINRLTLILNEITNESGEKINIKGDPIIQIGTVFHRYGDNECFDRSIIVIGNEDKPTEKICDDLEGINVFPCKTEKELLLKWKDLILYRNPDLITGYNIFGFDFDYINQRVNYLFPCEKDCKKTRCCLKCPKNQFYRLGRLMRNVDSDRIKSMDGISKSKMTLSKYNNYWEKSCKIANKELSSSGLGDNVLKYISMDGRIVFDIQKEIQKGHALDSYKLDDVSSHFMKGNIIEVDRFRNREKKITFTRIRTNNLGNLKVGDYVMFNINTKYGLVKYKNGKKFNIIGLWNDDKQITVGGLINFNEYKKETISIEWCLSKDDVSPQEIFSFHKTGGSEGRAKIAKYCIMDCELCIHLLLLLDLIPNNIGMATVSSVPLSYIFLRGQGIKINSLVTKECSKHNTRIPTLKNYSDSKIADDGFEGAIVLDPDPGIYEVDPVSVLDYASLYPNSIIENNFSHETYIGTQDDIDKNPEKYNKILEKIPHTITPYDDYISELKGKTVHKTKAGTQTTCYYATRDYTKGIIPTILENLLDQRKKTRSKIKQTDDENKKKVLDGFQLAYKVTANSVYGQMGAKTSSIFFKKIAACTTSIGRSRIYDARDGVVSWASAMGYNKPVVVYGDTDSVFVKFSRIHHETGEELHGKEGLQYCIDCGIKAGEWITENIMNPNWNEEKYGKGPQDLEYEKTFYPFILISKKRYTGDKYEYKSDKPKERTSMGIVMKRRDNAPIVKYVFGNVIEIIMNQSVDIAIEWLRKALKQIKNGEMNESMFIISKSLRGYYKNPDAVAHKVLADRMAERNPGNKPKPNDRIPYMYRKLPDNMLYDFNNRYKSGANKGKPRNKKILQGDRIEHPDYIRENNLEIDYNFYITNSIMNPVKQVLDLEKDEEYTKEIFNDYLT